MPTFDVVSEVDAQEVRNAVDQASRELGQRYDFKGTNSSIELGDNEITLHTASEDRLTALKQLPGSTMMPCACLIRPNNWPPRPATASFPCSACFRLWRCLAARRDRR